MICFKVSKNAKIELDVDKTDFNELLTFSPIFKRFNSYLINTGNTRADNNRFALDEIIYGSNFTIDRFIIQDDGAIFYIEAIKT